MIARPTIGRWEFGDETMRLVLGERWSDAPLIGWVGMNPSRASAERNDPTWSTWKAFAQRWGAGGQVVVNPVPVRSSDPAEALDMLIEHRAGRSALSEGFRP